MAWIIKQVYTNGNINCDYLGDIYYTHKIKNCLLSLGLTQIVPTRTVYSSTLIDCVILFIKIFSESIQEALIKLINVCL